MGLSDLWHRLRTSRTVHRASKLLPNAARPLPDDLWHTTLDAYPFLQERPDNELAHLRLLSSHFLGGKEFHGAEGLVVTDAMAIAIAAQACLPLLHFGPPAEALAWYGDFVGIVVHAGEVVARREAVDDAGVVHFYDEVLSGEAMERGPVMLSWHDVAQAGASAQDGYNVVVHEFIHKMPPLAARLHGQHQRPRSTRRMVCGAAARVRQIPRAGHHRRAFWWRTALAGCVWCGIDQRVFPGGLRGVLCEPQPLWRRLCDAATAV